MDRLCSSSSCWVAWLLPRSRTQWIRQPTLKLPHNGIERCRRHKQLRNGLCSPLPPAPSQHTMAETANPAHRRMENCWQQQQLRYGLGAPSPPPRPNIQWLRQPTCAPWRGASLAAAAAAPLSYAACSAP
eukprot:364988-Chlamydomonas_euryale.AAC.3